MTDKIKQIIVMRTKFINSDGKEMGMRRGKEIAQACHASISFITRRMQNAKSAPKLKEVEQKWIDHGFAKICVRVDSERELLEVFQKAKSAGLEAHLVIDSGKTEFKEPTKTCIAIGPDYSSKIDPITGHLKLL